MFITCALGRPGSFLAAVAPHGAMSVAGMDAEQTGWLWEALRRGTPFERLVAGLGCGQEPDSGMPDFAAVVLEGDAVRAGVRGAYRVLDAFGKVLVSGEGAQTWNEKLIEGHRELVLEAGSEVGEGRSLPIGDGLVEMSALRLLLAKSSRRRSQRVQASAGSPPSAAWLEPASPSESGHERSEAGGVLQAVPQAAKGGKAEPAAMVGEPDFFIDSVPEDARYPEPEEDAERRPAGRPAGTSGAASASSPSGTSSPASASGTPSPRIRRGAHSWRDGDRVAGASAPAGQASGGDPLPAGRGSAESPAAAPAASGKLEAETAEYKDYPLADGGTSPEEDFALVDTFAPDEPPSASSADSADAGGAGLSWTRLAQSGSWPKTPIIAGGGHNRIAGPLGQAVSLGGGSEGQKSEQVPVAAIPTANSAALASLEMASADSSASSASSGFDFEQSHAHSPVDSGISASPLVADAKEQEMTGGMPLSAISSIMPRSRGGSSPSQLIVPDGAAAGRPAQSPAPAAFQRSQAPRRPAQEAAYASRAAGVRDQLSSASNATAMVLALLCQYGHLNPPHGSSCRLCGAPIGGEPNWYPRPALGEIYLSTGLRVPIDADIVIGRKPASTPESGRPRAHLVPVPSPDQQISRIHCEIRVDGWDVRLVDRNSNNGTYVLRQGEQPIRIRPSEPFFVRVGDVVDIGEGVTIHMLGPQAGG